MKIPKLFSYHWDGNQCYAQCLCGWKSEGVHVVYAAKALFGRHVREDCPIGNRMPPK